MSDKKNRFARGHLINNLRIVSGLILFTFAAFHLTNHALGLISIDAMSAMREYRIMITRSLPGTIILISAIVVHGVLGLAKFISRRAWKMSAIEAVQLIFGILIPVFLARHVLGTRGAHELFGIDDDYVYALFVMWPGEALNQLVLITLVWVHGSIGIYMWLRMKPWFEKVSTLLLGLAILIPVLAFSGFSVAGRIIRNLYEFKNPFTPEQFIYLKGWMDWALWTYLAFLVGFVLFRLAMTLWARWRRPVVVEYFNGPTVKTSRGFTLLETSRAFDIPHASICGGKARCSTCRVRVLKGFAAQPGPEETEARVLARIGATDNVRLACQLRPVADLSVVPLLPAQRTRARDAQSLDKYFWGVEQQVTLLFADLRGFTKMSENQLPYDVVFLLNQFLGNMSQAIEDAGGYIDKFMGDGIMAIFGMDSSKRQGARQALVAARAMSGVLDGLNMSLADELPSRLNIGMGIHSGDAILGRIGVASTSGAGDRITALGDTVNTASRLETATKELQVQLLVSDETMRAAGIETADLTRHEINVKGKTNALVVYGWKKATTLEIPQAGSATAIIADKDRPSNTVINKV